MSNDRGDWANLPGRLIVLSGPSGSGKSTLAKRLLALPGLRLKVSISATTRRPGQASNPTAITFFVTNEQFEQMRDDLLESAQVHGNDYGTPRRAGARGDGRGNLCAPGDRCPGRLAGASNESPVPCWSSSSPPILKILEARLRARGTDDETDDRAPALRRATRARARVVL